MKINKFVSAILAVCMILSAFSINTYALDNGTYTMNTLTHYLNPDTGKTDDGGTGNAELGEGMCRSAVYETAVVEQKDDSVEITMTMLLYSNLSNIRFALKDSTTGQYNDIKYSVVKESSSNDSADLKFTAPTADTMVRVQMYVAPMGRDVCFYWNCDASTAVSGSTEQTETTETKEESTASAFTDINKHWAESDILAVVNKGLFSGVTATTFEPETSMTRGMFVTVLGRLSGEEISGTSSFSDVDSSKYYSPYIAWASSKGIVSGTSASTFDPDTSVTCEQAALIITKYAEYKGITFEDKSISPSTTGVSAWAQDYVVKAGKAGIITKQNTNGYDYTSPATRADVASMLNNFIKYYAQ